MTAIEIVTKTPWKLKREGIGSPGSGVMGACEAPDVVLGTEAQSSARAAVLFSIKPVFQLPHSFFLTTKTDVYLPSERMKDRVTSGLGNPR